MQSRMTAPPRMTFLRARLCLKAFSTDEFIASFQWESRSGRIHLQASLSLRRWLMSEPAGCSDLAGSLVVETEAQSKLRSRSSQRGALRICRRVTEPIAFERLKRRGLAPDFTLCAGNRYAD